MTRTPPKLLALVAAVLAGAAPLIAGVFRAMSTGDRLWLWMAVVSSMFVGSVLAAAIGRRRGRAAVLRQTSIIFVVGTLLSVTTAFVAGETVSGGVWAVSFAMGLSLAAASALVALARPTQD